MSRINPTQFKKDLNLSIEQILSNYNDAYRLHQESQQRWIDLTTSNAPYYLVDAEYLKIPMYFAKLRYWEKVRKAKMRNKVQITIQIG